MEITMKGDYDIIEIKKDNINLIKDLWEKIEYFIKIKQTIFFVNIQIWILMKE